jgi:hypothetical protein
MSSFYALLAAGVGFARHRYLSELPVGAVFVEAHADRRDSLGQPTVYGTLKALWEFQGARYGLDDERRVALRTGHAFFGDSRLARGK